MWFKILLLNKKKCTVIVVSISHSRLIRKQTPQAVVELYLQDKITNLCHEQNFSPFYTEKIKVFLNCLFTFSLLGLSCCLHSPFKFIFIVRYCVSVKSDNKSISLIKRSVSLSTTYQITLM